MELLTGREVAVVPDLRHRVRQLRWFKASFRQHANLVGRRYGFAVKVDDARLTEAFLNWAERFSADRAYAKLDRRDFMIFTAGLMLRELLALHPVTVEPAAPPVSDEPDSDTAMQSEGAAIAQAWPEGFVCTNYCLCILSAVFEQEAMPLPLADLADDLRTWWSYRENVGEDASQAIAFLDLLTGNEPNWFMPDSVSSRLAMKKAMNANLLPTATSRIA